MYTVYTVVTAKWPLTLGRGAALTLAAMGVPILVGGEAALTHAAGGPISLG